MNGKCQSFSACHGIVRPINFDVHPSLLLKGFWPVGDSNQESIKYTQHCYSKFLFLFVFFFGGPVNAFLTMVKLLFTKCLLA